MEHALKVSELNLLIRSSIESEILFQNIFLIGEITNMKFYGSTLYFDLNDGDASMNAVMYTAKEKLGNLALKTGMAIRAKGSLKFYPKKGRINFQANFLIAEGQGNLNAAFEALKKKLSEEGLFDSDIKRPLPLYPMHIAVVTAEGSAAMWDFVSILKEKMPHTTITIINSTVQGANCPPEVIAAINTAESLPTIDCIVVMRGGGSPEDLAGFNDESLVRRVAMCQVPVISAIGHEIDFTLCDFAADFRAPTPSAAAAQLSNPFRQKKDSILQRLGAQYAQLRHKHAQHHHTVSQTMEQISRTLEYKITQYNQHLEQIKKRLITANPLHKLNQGYSIVRNAKGLILKELADCEINDTVTIQLLNGHLEAVIAKKESNHEY
jgi:exodeoxyribonuclease VII large subunit